MRWPDLLRRDRLCRDADGALLYQFVHGAMGAQGTIGRLPRLELGPEEFLSFEVQPHLNVSTGAGGAWQGEAGFALGVRTVSARPVPPAPSEETGGAANGMSTARRPAPRATRLVDRFRTARQAERARRRLQRAYFAQRRSTPSAARAAAVMLAGAGLLFVLAAIAEQINPSRSPQVAAAAATNEAAPTAPTPAPAPSLSSADQAITFGPGHLDPKRTVYVFSDPNCPACRHFEREIGQLTRQGLDVALFPVAFRPGSSELVRDVMCAPDRAAAWAKAARGEAIAPADCPQGRQIALLNNALFSGARMSKTPTIVLPNDQRIEGAVTAQQIRQRLGG